MRQTATPVSMERYGAISQVSGSYTRSVPPEVQQPAVDWFLMNISRFESAQAATEALPDINSDGMASLEERWPVVELTETELPVPLPAASRHLLSGTATNTRGDLLSHITVVVVQVNDVVGLISGYSDWSPTELEVAFLSDIVMSLAATHQDADLSDLLPPTDLLIGGLQESDT